MRPFAVLLIAVATTLVACGGDDGGTTVDAPTADAPASDDGSPGDAPLTDGPAIADAATDASAPDGPLTNLGPVDCRVEADCPGLSSCNVSAPGGVCNGCGSDNDCPTGTSCGQVGACVRDCVNDGDCSAGKRCLTGSGVCAIRQCSAQSPCPAPYVCVGTLCQRPPCGSGGSCPAPMTCGATNICVEP